MFDRSSFRTSMFALLALIVVSPPAWADPGRTETGQPAGSAVIEAAASAPLQRATLNAGAVKATVEVPNAAVPLAAGGSTFASLVLTTTGKTPGAAELRLSVKNAAIKSVHKADARISNDGSSAIIPVTGLRSGRQTQLLAEIALNAAGADGRAELSAQLTGADGQSGADAIATFVWTLKDCAGGFRQALSEAADTRLALIDESLGALRPGRNRPALKWAFQPDLRALPRDCRGPRCPAANDPEAPSQAERNLILEAQTFIRNGGADPELTTQTNLGWPTFKAASDLKGYLKQPPNPAICTGALQFSNYYLKNLGRLKARVERVREMASGAGELVSARVALLRNRSANLPGGHPGWGGATLAATRSNTPADLKSAVSEIAKLAGIPEQGLREVDASADLTGALSALASHWDDAAVTEKEFLTRARFALSLAEAADVVQRLSARYDAIETNFIGTFRMIKDAYRSHCSCNAN
jgi:hypothetical protein